MLTSIQWQWYTPLREAMSAFVDSTQENVTGNVTVKLYKGNISPACITSDNSLYSEDLATFSEDEVYNQKMLKVYKSIWSASKSGSIDERT